MIEQNAVIKSWSIDNERGLGMWIHLEFGESCGQAFGGYILYSPDGWKGHDTQWNFCGDFIYNVMKIAGVSDLKDIVGKNIRIRKESWLDVIHSIGHIIKDEWWSPKESWKEKE